MKCVPEDSLEKETSWFPSPWKATVLPLTQLLFRAMADLGAHTRSFLPPVLGLIVSVESSGKDFKSRNLISADGVSRLCVDPDINKL